VTGFTYNFTNTATNYQNGIDWHLDWGASQFLSKQVQVGLVGYFYDQLTPDRGCLPVLCPLESGVIGVGPQLGYLFPVGNMQVGNALPGELLTAAFCDNRHIDRSGIRYSELPAEGRERLEALLATYTGRVRPGHAEIRYSEVKRYLNETIFAWIGQCDATSPFYYRILSPVILVEFDHMPGIVYDNDEPSRDHIHTIVRTPNGNDYGKDLLHQHYAEHDHSHAMTAHRQGHV
jgi:hypothetical protein